MNISCDTGDWQGACLLLLGIVLLQQVLMAWALARVVALASRLTRKERFSFSVGDTTVTSGPSEAA